jgi:hypothetical protein
MIAQHLLKGKAYVTISLIPYIICLRDQERPSEYNL